MDIVALAQEAIKVVNHPVSSNLFLQLPGKWGKSNHRYLAGENSPKGQIVQAFVGKVVVCFDAVDVLAWCVANSGGKITVSQPATEQGVALKNQSSAPVEETEPTN